MGKKIFDFYSSIKEMDFVVNKVLKRSITALLGPVLLYSGVFNIGKLIG